jgi:hypothetical protein
MESIRFAKFILGWIGPFVWIPQADALPDGMLYCGMKDNDGRAVGGEIFASEDVSLHELSRFGFVANKPPEQAFVDLLGLEYFHGRWCSRGGEIERAEIALPISQRSFTKALELILG